MDDFLGTWKQQGKPENMKEVMDAADVDDKVKNAIINGSSTVTISQSEDRYLVNRTIDNPKVSILYTLILGETLAGVDMFGKRFKSVFVMKNPKLLTEHRTLWSKHPIDCTYEIIGDTLIWKMKCKDSISTTNFKKIA